MSDSVSTYEEFPAVDLTNCDREPIHLLGRTQPFGFMMAVSTDWMIAFVSTNISDFLSIEAEECVGSAARDYLPEGALHAIRNRVQNLRSPGETERLRDLPIGKDGSRFDLSIHLQDSYVVLDFEPSRRAGDNDDEGSIVRSVLPRISSSTTALAACKEAARCLQLIIGFDRVMVYKFLPDGSGEVISEAKRGGLDPFLNLRYPASDIPKQARALYLRHPLRLIADTQDSGVPIHPQRGIDGAPVDLSASALRAVSPIHLEYLKNMGVAASMSLSIIVDGKLWGLFACHHSEPIVLDHAKRAAVELFGQLFSLVLASRENDEERLRDGEVRRLMSRYSATVSSAREVTANLVPMLTEFCELLRADGFALVLDGQQEQYGVTPSPDELLRVFKFLNTAAANTIFSTHELSSVFFGSETFADRASGLLSIPISRSPRDYIVFFRREVTKTITWGGNPDKPVTVGPNGTRLTPRKSFDAWKVQQSNQSEAWTNSDLRIAEQLRMMVLEVVLRYTDEAAQERKKAQERQELLIAELNHRVRNILSLVRGIVSQSRNSELSVSEYIDLMDVRIQSLARAHDQITQENWKASSFHKLVRVESASYLTSGPERVKIDGEDCRLEPEAFSTMALVIHELLTNSAKYGALSSSEGQVRVTTGLKGKSNDFTIKWSEEGGPAVQAPTRRGFGSTIIERSVPYELKGEATIDYALAGLQASFEIPGRYVQKSTEEDRMNGDSHKHTTASQSSSDLPFPRNILVVEDNLILAMELEDLLLSLGAENVDVASSIRDAQSTLERARPQFAILDVNLGRTTSFPIAEALLRKDIPFGFATGYGEGLDLPANLKNSAVITKPYSTDSVRQLIQKQMAKRK